MTRRTVTLAALLGVTAIALGSTYVLGDESGPPTVGTPPALTAVVGADAGAGAGDADGDLDDRTVSVDSEEPAVSRLNPELLAALRDAARDAADDGIEVRVTSGWRSRDYQRRLLEEAIATYGSRAEALRWVATPDTSAHVTGDAVDVGPTGAAYWMSEHGADFGLCQAYGNEIWHYELLTARGGICPPPRADGTA